MTTPITKKKEKVGTKRPDLTKTPEKWGKIIQTLLMNMEIEDIKDYRDGALFDIRHIEETTDQILQLFYSHRTQDREEIIKDIEKIKDEEDYTIIHTVPFGPEIQSICSQVWRQSIEHIIYILNSKKGEI